MTCIVGFTNQTHAWIASDIILASNSISERLTYPKTFIKDEFIFATSGNVRACQLLQHCWTPPPFKKSIPIIKYMCQNFAPSIKQLMVDNDLIVKNDDGIGEIDMIMIVAFRGKLFEIHRNCAVIEVERGYTSMGSGSEYALGAMTVLFGSEPNKVKKIDAELSLVRALRIANLHSPFVDAGVIHIANTKEMVIQTIS